MNNTFSKTCVKCKMEDSAYCHCIFDCFHIKAFWSDVQEFNNILGISLDVDPLVCILGIFSYNTWSSSIDSVAQNFTVYCQMLHTAAVDF